MFLTDDEKSEVLKHIRAGLTLGEVAAHGFDTEAILNTIDEDPKFGKTYESSKVARAEIWFEEAMELARSADSKVNYNARKLRIDTLKWGASLSNPKYSAKADLSGLADGRETIIITGVVRGENELQEPEPGRAKEAEAETSPAREVDAQSDVRSLQDI